MGVPALSLQGKEKHSILFALLPLTLMQKRAYFVNENSHIWNKKKNPTELLVLLFLFGKPVSTLELFVIRHLDSRQENYF